MRLFLLPYFTFYLFLLLNHFPSYTHSLCNPHDSSVLLQFKNSLALETSAESTRWPRCSSFASKTESWKNGTDDCCQWDGVTCNIVSGRVIGLDLSCSHLKGKLSPNSTIFKLKQLQQLNLAFNDFSGSSVPVGIGDLVNLMYLNLSNCEINGDIPSAISQLSKLASLSFSNDWLDDPSYWRMRFDPITWKKLILNATNLRELRLDSVDMSSIGERSLTWLMNLSSSLVSLSLTNTGLQGNFPSYVLSLPNLQELDLSFNPDLSGQLPNSNWSTPLRYLDLSLTSFSGEIPYSIGDLKYLNQLSLQACRFHGLVPQSFWNLTQLTNLTLANNKFSGEIPSLISNLRHLASCDLQYNNFTGHLPDVFDKLTDLKFLSLSNNNLGGQVPSSLFHLTELSFLDLSYNKLVGFIPTNISQHSKLNSLSLDDNMLSGTIPHWCFTLPSLKELYLNANQLTGTLSEFSNSMKSLCLSNNKLQGNFPNSIFEFENLITLSLSSTNLSGIVEFHRFSKFPNMYFLDLSHNSFLSININSSADNILPSLETLFLSSSNFRSFPKFLAQLQSLKILDLSNNNIHGKIPNWFHEKLLHSWKDIQHIDLSSNKLQGELPIPPYGIQYLLLSNNNFTGDISSTFCNASSLTILNLANNNLTGMIPQCLGTFSSLSVLDLQMNHLYGSIPMFFSEVNAFATIKLNGNQLEGPLPRSLANCTKLEVFDLGGNNIEDTFPSWLETLQELQVLSLRSNKLHGEIICFNSKNPFPKLRIFDVSNNNFSGSLPTSCIKDFQGMKNASDSQNGLQYMGNDKYYNDSVVVVMKGQYMELTRILTTFTTIDLSKNMLEGEIPNVIGELNSLKGLNLSHNGITGTIPQSLSDLRNLEWLDLSTNQLTGEIPVALTNLNFLSFLNISQNMFEGMIPTSKQFGTFGSDSYEGNANLCGFPLSKSCDNDEGQPLPSSPPYYILSFFEPINPSSTMAENKKLNHEEESSPLLHQQQQPPKAEQQQTQQPPFHGWTADGLPMGHGSVMGQPIPRSQWSSSVCACLGQSDHFCSSDLEVCLLGSVAPCVLYGTNVERLGSNPESNPGTFANHCLHYSGLYVIGNSCCGWNALAPWFSYTSRTAIRRRFNLEGSCEALNRSCGCCGSFLEDEVKREQNELVCDLATHVFCHLCALCQEGRELRRRVPHPGFNAQPVLVMIPPGEQSMGRGA